MQETIFTIGHSTHSQARFVSLLRQHRVTALCDVRSQPYSRVNPQFNREELKKSLRAFEIKYVFLGKELGARTQDPTCYDDGKVRYDRLARTELFRQGLERVLKGAKVYRVALMCAEKEPLECHRTILVARHLAELGFEIQHIHADGTLESHADAMNRLANMLKLGEKEHHLFRSSEELLVEAYHLQEERIAYDAGANASSNVRTLRSAAG
ncbi:MAG: DUF488 domain-containing protein [Candidatus Acidiferrales bacterium]